MKPLLFLLYSLFFLPLCAQDLSLRAPNEDFKFVDQRNGPVNSCGPASLLNAFGAGSDKWQKAYAKIPGTNDRSRISAIIKSWGLAPSAKLPDHKKWSPKSGCNFVDLTTMAEEFRKLQWNLPKLKSELYFASSEAESQAHLKLAHKRLSKSLKKGFPPILSIRRFVYRNDQWQSIHGHFVVLTAMPSKLTDGSNQFAIEFNDPAGAKVYQGQISASQSIPSLILQCPTNTIGKNLVRKGEKQALAFTGAIGVW